MLPSIKDRLVASLESSALPEDVEINPVTNNTETELDKALEAVDSAEVEVTESEAAEDTLTAAAEGVEEATDMMEEEIAEKGEVSVESYRSLNLAIKNAVRGLPGGVQLVQAHSVSNESFVSLDKVVVSAEALDKAKEILMKLWNAVKDAAEKVWTAIKDWFGQLTASGDWLIKAADDLKKRAGAIQGKSAKNGEVSVAPQLKALVVGNDSVKEGATVVNAVKSAADSVVQLGGIVKEIGATYGKQAAEISRVGAGEATSISFDQEFVKATEAFTAAQQKADGVKIPGGNVLKFSKKGNQQNIVIESAGGNTGEYVEVMNQQEIVQLSNELRRLGNIVKNFDKEYFRAIEAQLKADVAKARANINKDLSSADQVYTKVTLKLIEWTGSAVKQPAPKVVSLAAKAGKAAYEIANASLKQYA